MTRQRVRSWAMARAFVTYWATCRHSWRHTASTVEEVSLQCTGKHGCHMWTIQLDIVPATNASASNHRWVTLWSRKSCTHVACFTDSQIPMTIPCATVWCKRPDQKHEFASQKQIYGPLALVDETVGPMAEAAGLIACLAADIAFWTCTWQRLHTATLPLQTAQ